MARVRASRPGFAGFTLVELVIALAVLAILAGAAWPPYADSVRKGRRADAVQAAARVQQAQEAWLGNQGRYSDRLGDIGLAATSPGGHYALALSGASATAYTLTVSAASGGPQSADAGCTVLTVSVLRGQASFAPANCWSR